MSNTLVRLSAVHCNLDRDHWFADLNWNIRKGQHWAIVGGNGAGKTALAKILGGLIPIASGSIENHPESCAEHGIAYVSFEEQAALHEHDRRFDDSELREDASDPGTLARDAVLQGQQAGPQFEQWVTMFRLQHILQRGIRYLSSGEMRKVLMLRAVLSQPAILVLDNPLEGLDRASLSDMTALISQLAAGVVTIVLLSRRREDILPAITHLLLLQDLQLIASGARADIEQNAAYQQIFPPLPPPPERLPTPDPMLEVYRPPAGLPLVAMHKLNISYHDNAVMRDIDFVLLPGQHTSISGPNGCGKSTLLSLMAGDNHKAYGQDITLFGSKRGSGESVWDIKRKFGLVSNHLQQNYGSGFTVLEVVISGFFDSIGLYQSYGGCETRTAREWLQALGMLDLAKVLYRKLSYGQQRMVLLARAMVKYPPILILDEPCTGLDEYNRALFLRTLDAIAAHTDTTLVFVSHLPGEIPACIKQELVFRPRPEGLYALVEGSS